MRHFTQDRLQLDDHRIREGRPRDPPKGDLTSADLRFLTETDEVTHIARVAVDELRLFARLGARRRGIELGGTIELEIPPGAAVTQHTGVTFVTRMDGSPS